jgi:ubiquitin C-terminal hydrolase
LKRFRQVGFHFQKVSGNISFPLEWNFSSYTQKNSSESDFFLSGIVVHQGSLEWGHYIAYVRASCSPQEHRWYCCSDEYVTLVDEEQVLQSEAYILFYCKKQLQ